MRRISKKLLTVLTAGTLAVNGVMFHSLASFATESTKYEIESGTVTGTIKEDASASGGSYVFFENGGEKATVNIPIETTGMYDIIVGYSSPYGDKIEYLTVNGANSGSFSCTTTDEGEWVEVNTGSVKLTAGDNEIGVECSWGWVNIDYIRVEEAVLPEVIATDTACCDTEATAETQKLMEYLSTVYGKNVLSGQQEYYGVSRDDEFNYIQEKTGELPVIRGFDFGDTCPLYAWDDGTASRVISWVKDSGGIATASWHINVPTSMSDYTEGGTLAWDKTTYSEKTDFVTANCMIEGTTEHEYFLRAVDNLATELKKIADADVPLLFRPFHEAEGNGGADGSGAWFWWSKEGADVYVQLYQYLYDLLTNEYDLHNLIWEFNSYTYSDESAWFYPGADYVDIIGYDKYNATNWSTGVTTPNESAISSTFYGLIEMYDNTKMIAMMENDTIPSVENMTEEGAYWLYFMPWYGEHLMDSNYNNPDTLAAIYQSDLVITLDEFKEAYAAFEPSGTTQSRVTTSGTSRTTTTTASTPAPDPSKGDPGSIAVKSGNYNVTFDRAIGDTVILDFTCPDTVAYANGCVGISVNVDGTDYWVSYMWEIDGAGDITFKLDDPFEISYNAGAAKVEDADQIAKISAVAQEQTSAQIQVWWANDGDENSVKTSEIVLIGAYLPKSDSSDVTTSSNSETTTTTTTTANPTATVPADVTENNDYYDITFDRSIGDTVILDFIVAPGGSVSYANGCIGISATVDGTDYWVSYKWEMDSVGEITVTLDEPFEISYNGGTDKVEDADMIAAISATAQEQNAAQVQVWWVNNPGGDSVPTDQIALTGAYLPLPNSSENTDVTESSATTETTTVSSDETTTTTTKTTGDVAPTLYGDINVDGRVDITDAVLLNKAVAGQVKLSDQAAANADCYKNNEVNGDDSITLLKFLVHLVDSIPVTE
ncbi:MAG: glycosyl hydrolase [Ruminococcus sp.]